MKQFIFDVLKMYIEFLLYNYEIVDSVWQIIASLFGLICCGFYMYNRVIAENEESSQNNRLFALSAFFIVYILYKLILPSQETLHHILTMLKT